MKKMLNASIDSDLFFRLKLYVVKRKQRMGNNVTQESIVEEAIKEYLEKKEKEENNVG
jgi:hypothetical protein